MTTHSLVSKVLNLLHVNLDALHLYCVFTPSLLFWGSPRRAEAVSHDSGLWMPTVQDRPHLQRGDPASQKQRGPQGAVHGLLAGARQTKGDQPAHI